MDHGNSQVAQADHGNGNAGNTQGSQGHGNSGNTGNGGGGNVDSTEASLDTSNLPGNSEAGLENALANGKGNKYGIYKHLANEGDTVVNGEIVPVDGSSSGTPAGFTSTVNGQSSFTYYYHPDHLGSTGFVTDANGKLYEHMEYFPFGETWVDEHSNTLRTPYLFTGKEYDQETGLYYFGARYYDPRTSVWQSADAILGSYLGGTPNGGIFVPMHLALYTYVLDNPLIHTDPDGNNEDHTDDPDVPGGDHGPGGKVAYWVFKTAKVSGRAIGKVENAASNVWARVKGADKATRQAGHNAIYHAGAALQSTTTNDPEAIKRYASGAANAADPLIDSTVDAMEEMGSDSI